MHEIAMAERTALCQVDTLEPGEMVRVEVAGEDPLLLINDAGVFRLLDDDCTHAIASLSEGRLDGNILSCPLHGGSFDIRTGKAKSLPCKQALRTHKVIVESGMVYFEG
ncbi:non-heme iron oxygenase ferredoxin subunit [Sphingomonas sp. HF-S4]|uniref:Non-heme iron oxygenase ferredoxin subunit n=1 Tax=Sphingomonas agrestis TaxID=3080540 RepID=A0ABU3Y1W3_9SPHN|nr:non-heme iron oxygenase ferredoxin subunit [Sphingomonas sp. HF-S4]MDV3455373.1 non-heme iron oxygenase ferredoxin subunit [Sphingomonas sp. HF-S4]